MEGFRRCVLDRDVVTLTRIPGIGRKTAERLLVEMADRVDQSGINDLEGKETASGVKAEAHGALLALGYRPAEVTRMLADLDTAQLGAEELIREALKRVHAR